MGAGSVAAMPESSPRGTDGWSLLMAGALDDSGEADIRRLGRWVAESGGVPCAGLAPDDGAVRDGDAGRVDCAADWYPFRGSGAGG